MKQTTYESIRPLWRVALVLVLLVPVLMAQLVTNPGSVGGGGSGTVSSGTANQLAYYAASGTTVSGLTTGNGGVLTTSAAGVPSISSVPVLGTDNSTAGTITLANGAANAHTVWGSGATTSNTINGFAVVPTTGHLLDCTVASTTCLLHDSGVITANVVNASSPAVGIAHFAGSTQTVTSSLIVGSDITGAAGQIYAGSGPALTATPALGTDNSAAGTLQLANGSANAHTIWSSGATTTNTIQGFATVPTTGHLLDCTVTSTTCLLHDSGLVTSNVVNASSPGAGVAHFAGSTQTVTSSTIATGDIAANAVTSAKLAVVNTYHVCDIAVGDTSGSAITDAQLGPQKHICKIPTAATVVEIDVDSDAGSPQAIVGRGRCTTFTSNTCSAETIVNLVSSALAVSSGFEKCSNTGGTTGLDGGTTCSSTLQNTGLSAGDWIQLVSGTAGGTAKFFAAHIVWVIN